MKLQQIYKSDINRNINGVIQVDQDDNEVIKQELSEYIITKELRGHYNAFFNNYKSRLITGPIKSVSGYRAFSEAVNRTF